MPRCAKPRTKPHDGTTKQNYLWWCDEHLAEMQEHRAEIIADLEERRRNMNQEYDGQLQPRRTVPTSDRQGPQRGRRPVAPGQRGRASGPEREDPSQLVIL